MKYGFKGQMIFTMRNKALLFLILAMGFCSAGCGRSDEPKNGHPNIIYILADDLGYGDVSAFNKQSKIKTPNIDRLAREGMRFTDAHTSSAVCSPTRYGILTGRYNWRSPLKEGVLWSYDDAIIPTSRETVASLLKKAGYHTAYIGKWHLGWRWGMDEEGNVDYAKPITNTPNDVGFDYAYGHIASLDIPPYVYVENGRATAIPEKEIEKQEGYGFYRRGPIAPDFDMMDVTPNFFRRAIDYVKKRARSKQPFFLYLPLPSPHTPILPTEEWQGKSGLNPYGDFVMMVDNWVGRLMKAVKKAGIAKNTIVIFTSDNGCSPMANFEVLREKGHDPSYIFRGHKADIYEGGHRVPFIIRWPERIAPGLVTAKTICTTDLLATCAEIVGIAPEAGAAEDSYSLVPLFDDKYSPDYGREYTIHSSVNGSFAIRKGDWKLILCPGSGGWSFPRPKKAMELGLPPVQLYNLREDASEFDNVYDQYPDTVRVLYNLLVKSIEDGRSTAGMPQQNDAPLKGESWEQFEKVKELKEFVEGL